MRVAKHDMEKKRFSSAELRVRALASRRASKQLLRVPWNRFRRAYQDYPRWQALALWSRAVINAAGGTTAELLRTLRKRCPDFLALEAPAGDTNLLAFRFLEWVHNKRFDSAKSQGWLDALTFYGVRHFHSQAAWAFGEYSEDQWSRTRPKEFPSFEEWWQRALEMKVCGATSYLDLAAAVERYINWEEAALWLRPLRASNIKLPAHVVSGLERAFPASLRRLRAASGGSHHKKPTDWRSLLGAAKQHCLAEIKAAGWLDLFMEQVQFHPSHVRLMAFGKQWRKGRSGSQPPHHPSFREWRRAAARYSEVSSPLRAHYH